MTSHYHQVHAVGEASKPKVTDVNVSDTALASAYASGLFHRFSRLRGIPLNHALDRLASLRLVNVLVTDVLPLVDFGPSRAEWSLANRVARLRDRLLFSTKEGLWRGIMVATMTNSGRPGVAINRARALKGLTSPSLPPVSSARAAFLVPVARAASLVSVACAASLMCWFKGGMRVGGGRGVCPVASAWWGRTPHN